MAIGSATHWFAGDFPSRGTKSFSSVFSPAKCRKSYINYMYMCVQIYATCPNMLVNFGGPGRAQSLCHTRPDPGCCERRAGVPGAGYGKRRTADPVPTAHLPAPSRLAFVLQLGGRRVPRPCRAALRVAGALGPSIRVPRVSCVLPPVRPSAPVSLRTVSAGGCAGFRVHTRSALPWPALPTTFQLGTGACRGVRRRSPSNAFNGSSLCT